MNVHETKTNFSSLLAKLEKDRETIIICRNGELVAVPGQTAAANLQRAQGSARALACIGQRLAERIRCSGKWFRRGVETDTRGACAPLP
ncbi:MAG: type II toxin-antitoxin system Phd/YefM family antitoxin [Verrucomicrobia bacterium]|nr:type II toxin-antitoxin system Phd/YefM family antitoxin [Verrucomicrobiota bacterium]